MLAHVVRTRAHETRATKQCWAQSANQLQVVCDIPGSEAKTFSCVCTIAGIDCLSQRPSKLPYAFLVDGCWLSMG